MIYYPISNFYIILNNNREVMAFKSYIKNWGNNLKKYVPHDQVITKEMKSHTKYCNVCSYPITLYTICQDKYLSQLFVKQLNWKTPKLYFNGTNNTFTKEIFDLLPKDYVMKTTHGHSGKGCLCIKNNRIINKHLIISFEYLKNWIQNNYIICEEYLLDKTTSKYPMDYKCYVWEGIVKYICIVQKDFKSASMYTIDFKKKFKYYTINQNQNDIIPSKKSLETIKNYCWGLSGYKKLFLRVDFYIIDDEVIFGEFTPNPNNGYLYSKKMLSMLDTDIQRLELPNRIRYTF